MLGKLEKNALLPFPPKHHLLIFDRLLTFIHLSLPEITLKFQYNPSQNILCMLSVVNADKPADLLALSVGPRIPTPCPSVFSFLNPVASKYFTLLVSFTVCKSNGRKINKIRKKSPASADGHHCEQGRPTGAAKNRGCPPLLLTFWRFYVKKGHRNVFTVLSNRKHQFLTRFLHFLKKNTPNQVLADV